jgi:hypothetical protein
VRGGLKIVGERETRKTAANIDSILDLVENAGLQARLSFHIQLAARLYGNWKGWMCRVGEGKEAGGSRRRRRRRSAACRRAASSARH